MIILDDLLTMSHDQLHAILDWGYPLDLEEMRNTQYLGVDLSWPRPLVQTLLWQTFRKTFFYDEPDDRLRGWNVRMKQGGVRGPRVPMTGADGQPITFGHYHVRSAEGVRFPRGWQGGHYLDYTAAGNAFLDPARLGYTPLVAVNRGDMSLLLGWEVFKLGRMFLPLPSYWALELEGPLSS